MIAAAEKETPSAAATVVRMKKVLADLWSWKDDYIQPMQKVRAAQERARSYRAVMNLADKKFVQLSDPTMIGLTPSDDGRMAIGMDDRAYRHMVDYDGTYNDVYLVDTATGAAQAGAEAVSRAAAVAAAAAAECNFRRMETSARVQG